MRSILEDTSHGTEALLVITVSPADFLDLASGNQCRFHESQNW